MIYTAQQARKLLDEKSYKTAKEKTKNKKADIDSLHALFDAAIAQAIQDEIPNCQINVNDYEEDVINLVVADFRAGGYSVQRSSNVTIQF